MDCIFQEAKVEKVESYQKFTLVSLSNNKGNLTQQRKCSYHLHRLMESLVMVRSPQNISGDSGQNSIAAFSSKTEVAQNVFCLVGELNQPFYVFGQFTSVVKENAATLH